MSKKTKVSLVQASIFITIILFFTKIVGFFREIIFANHFGTSKEFDLYLIGVAIPIMLNTVFFYLAQNYFIPNYYKNKMESKKDDSKFFNESFWLFVGFGILLSITLLLFSRIIINAYTDGLTIAEVNLVENVFNIISLTIPLNTAFAISSSYFVANYKYHIPYITQLVNNIIILLLIIVLSNFIGIYSIPASHIIANLFQLLFILFVIRRFIKISFPSISTFRSISKVSLASFSITILIEFFSLSYVIIDRYFFPYVDQGGISALNYAGTIFNLPMSIFVASIGAILLPKFSNTFHNKDEINSFENGIKESLNAVILFMTPVLILFVFHGYSIINIIFERGVFNSGDTIITNELLGILSFGLIFYAAYSVINKILYSAQFLRSFLILVIFTIFVKFIFISFFVDSLKQNALAYSTIICYIILLFGGIFIIARKLEIHFCKSFIANIFHVISFSIIIYVSSNLIIKIFIDISIFQEILQLVLFIVIYFLTIYFADNSRNSILRKVFFSFAKYFEK